MLRVSQVQPSDWSFHSRQVQPEAPRVEPAGGWTAKQSLPSGIDETARFALWQRPLLNLPGSVPIDRSSQARRAIKAGCFRTASIKRTPRN